MAICPVEDLPRRQAQSWSAHGTILIARPAASEPGRASVATAVFAWNRHDEDCYCSRGSYTGLVFGGTVLIWAFGPGIIWLFLLEKRRRDGLPPMCSTWGYNLTGNASGVCPECGFEVRVT